MRGIFQASALLTALHAPAAAVAATIELDPGTGLVLGSVGVGTGRSVYLTADQTIEITSVGFFAGILPRPYDVVIYEGLGVREAPGEVVASLTARVGSNATTWNEVPINATLVAGQDYIINWRRFDGTDSWVTDTYGFFRWGDFSAGGPVDLGPVTLLDGREGYDAENYSNGASPYFRITYVPEPASAVLFAVGVSCLLMPRRRAA